MSSKQVRALACALGEMFDGDDVIEGSVLDRVLDPSNVHAGRIWLEFIETTLGVDRDGAKAVVREFGDVLILIDSTLTDINKL